MNKGYRGSKSPLILFLLLLTGGLAGSALSGSLAKTLPVLATTGNIGMKPATLDLHFMQLTFGFIMNIGPLTVLGIILGYLVYRRA
ncbi:MAG: DUF4321 domain-containing protein [Desulfotomaculaceae bacterium]